MKVQEVIMERNIRRYLLLDDFGVPIIPVTKYIKFLDRGGRSPNTQKTYCYSLKSYFEFLSENDLNYRNINVNELSEFVGWLRSPYSNAKVTSLIPIKSVRHEKTVNLNITVVASFYDYLFRTEEINNNIIEKLMKQVFWHQRRYKGFLHHITKNKASNKNILKLKEPRAKIKLLSKNDIKVILANTNNIRDKFLIRLLFETGLRIGEALSLFIEDFIIDHKKGHIIRLTNRGELINNARQKTGERNIIISQELIDLFDDYVYEILDDMDTNFLFVKIKGIHKGEPLEYDNVSALFKKLRKDTKINIHPHLLRHTHASIFYSKVRDIKQLQERLGHANIQTTMNMYVHLSADELRKDWEKALPNFRLEGEYKSDKSIN